jgi:peptidoglycan hydrolase CwlO-like protein
VNSRRNFLVGLASAGTMLGVAAGSASPQNPPTMPRPINPGQEPANPDNPNAPSPEKRQLDENEKDIKKKVERLYELATELKAEVDKTDSSKVLSLNLLKKTEEIEKLAKDIRTRSKG